MGYRVFEFKWKKKQYLLFKNLSKTEHIFTSVSKICHSCFGNSNWYKPCSTVQEMWMKLSSWITFKMQASSVEQPTCTPLFFQIISNVALRENFQIHRWHVFLVCLCLGRLNKISISKVYWNYLNQSITSLSKFCLEFIWD